MKNNTNTNNEMKNNTNTNNKIMDTRFHIVLRGRHNELISWKGFADGEEAFNSFVGLYNYFRTITDGDIADIKGKVGFIMDGNKVTLERTTGKLLTEILMDSRSLAEDMFNYYLKKR